MEELAQSLNHQIQSRSVSSIYSAVKVIVLYWADGSKDFREEGQLLGEFFAKSFNYDVDEFPIPSTTSYLNLHNFVTKSLLNVIKAAKEKRGLALLIIHYGGHGDQNDDRRRGEEERSVWAAQSSGGPTLDWYRIQEDLEGSAADILLLLDCCFASQADRGRDASWARLEILAAAAMGVKTPMPGTRSFTRALINELKNFVEKNDYLGIDHLHRRLVSCKANLHATPVRISLTPGKRPLRLYPLSKVQLPYPRTDEEGTLYQIIFRTDTIPEKTHIDAIAAWLGEDKPVTVTAVGVQRVLQVTSQLKQVMDSLGRQEQPLAKVVGPPDFKNIVATWDRILTTIDQHNNQQSIHSEVHPIHGVSKEEMRSFLKHLDFQNEEMASTVRRAVMNSALMADLKMLNEAVEDPAFDILGIADQLRLRKMVLADFADVPKCQNGRDPDNKGCVLHEFKNYGQYADPAEMSELRARVANLTALLHASKGRDFLSLPCSRWYEEPLEYRFVLEFEIPVEYNATEGEYYSLQSVIRDLKGSEWPSLNTRLKLAHSLAKAIEQWHAADWLHQGINSINILFLKHKSTKQIDFSSPIS